MQNDNRAPDIIDTNAICMFLLVLILLIAANSVNRLFSNQISAPISTPALPTPAPVIIYQAVPTLVATPIIITRDIDNSDHRICILVVDCSQADRSN